MIGPLHPETGLHYLHVFPSAKVFEEIHLCYSSAAARLGWMSVGPLQGWNVERPEWQSSETALIFWGTLPEVPGNRKCLVAYRYTESVGKLSSLVENQGQMLEMAIAQARTIDVLLGGSPTVANFFAPYCKRTAPAPIGYDRSIMGTPDWTTKKTSEIAFRGTMVGRRQWLVPLLERAFGRRFSRIMCFGEERKSLLDCSRADLYIGHSDEPSFPGMRLWQATATSAALLTERRDAWPAAAGVHYVELPTAEERDPAPFLHALGKAIELPLEEFSRRAHEFLSRYTVQVCMEHFVIPAIAGVEDPL